mmetsp:Transcript_40140/g.35431  ORF Transcript_40140/g.35431 Transcript_40140/m.35431 type:complete len:195 (-) Transcript_40140:125-709(-)|eukprot:CAMPEP_0201577470 /NCGR_PEP_ID=MMETSP0190_2-20130828/23887_1 /ASSEMBLY_ACC=CAM_ASM_000263 /TAXON_ID=37353 /ORGANISM="Rosalina sp." /LENGTH=194 /DNA_ID=CAMNT_0048009553 /DNA_START=101 /DNA_END=688 /DNA_ORIENTATION=-
MSTDTKSEKKSYTFKICGMDKELSLDLHIKTSISDILEQLSTFCSIKSSSLQIRNGHESLDDIEKTLNDYVIHDPTNFLVLRDDILEEDKDEDEDTKDTDDDEDDGEEEDVGPLQSGDVGSKLNNNNKNIAQIMTDIASSIKSPTLPTVPNNSFATDAQQVKQNHQGLYSALEALSTSKNAKQLNSLTTSSKKN